MDAKSRRQRLSMVKIFEQMKQIILIIVAGTIAVACSLSTKNQKGSAEQQYINVDAKVRIYHADGRRTYKDFQPFKTRTVEILNGYQTPKELPKLSKYGGLIK